VRDKPFLPATTLRNKVMSVVILLESILDRLKPNYPAGFSDDDLFEFYCADNVLVNYDLGSGPIKVLAWVRIG
jgi:hypothetical protein